jgi:two-component system chemotaxis sensor kinase CheA
MSVDLSQFRQIFFEESLEGLEVMEKGLLNLDETADPELINAIFRAAHSIKGGSGTFGLSGIANFTHVMETVLDEMRDGRRPVSQSDTDVLLRSVDCLREMLDAAQEESEPDADWVAGYRTELEQLLSGGQSSQVKEVSAPVAEAGCKWHIQFKPNVDMMMTGNDPLRILWALEDLGTLRVACDVSRVPPLQALSPEECLLSWDMVLESEGLGQEAIAEVFEWVEDDCELTIEPISQKDARADAKPPVQEGDEEKADHEQPPVERRSEADRRKDSDRRSPMERRATTDRRGGATSSTIRVDTDKVDNLINMVGELVITQSMLATLGENFTMDRLQNLQAGLAVLERHTRELQESVMRIRMLPISVVFSRVPRLVRDLSSKLNKQVELKIIGESTELDKTVIEQVGDPLTHLVRNALDHGIEDPETRREAGKNLVGTLTLEAFHQGGNIVIQIRDDGAGLNRDRILAKAIERGMVAEDEELSDSRIYELIMQPGFSTAQEVSDVSGRGVGMDVVCKNIYVLGGSINIDSVQGKGSTFTIRLPLTLAILDGQTAVVGDEVYIVPLLSVIESIQIEQQRVTRVAGQGEVYQLRDEFIPIVRLANVFNIPGARAKDLSEGLLVVVEGENGKCGLFVDELLGQQQVVIKSLETNFKRVDGTSGATILGDGSVALILDIQSLMRLAGQGHRLPIMEART